MIEHTHTALEDKEMPNPAPNSRLQILDTVTDRHVIPVQDIDRPDLRHLVVRATGVGIAAGVGAPIAYSAAVAASLVHNSVAVNSDLTFTAVGTGPQGNNYSVEILQPVTADQVLTIEFDESKATIRLPTDVGGSPVAATATQVKAAWDGFIHTFPPFAALLTTYITVAVEGDGSGAVDTLAEASLANGADVVAGSGPAYLYVDTDTPGLYINTGTLEQPAWTAA